MKTIADLKRDMVIGRSLKLVFFETPFNVNNKNLNKVRYVVKTQGNGVYLNEDKQADKGSFLDYPKASLCEYDGKTLTIYEPGVRDLTKEEQSIIDNEPKDDEQEKFDMLTDGSTMFYRRKHYYQDKGSEYLFNGGSNRGKSKHVKRDGNGVLRVVDDAIKGKVSLRYEIGA